MADALRRLSEEDPTFRVRTEEQTGQVLISGMGELHLEVLVDRMLREFRVSANVGRPQVAYRETISRASRAEGRFIRQTGGRGQYGHVWLETDPLPAGQGIVFENAIIGGVIPREYISAVEAGVREALENGVLAGFPMVDIRVRLVDGSYHEVDSSDIAFKIAGSMGLKEAVQKAGPILLEPLMRVDVVAPDPNTGDVIGDISSRRGRVEGLEPHGPGVQIIHAFVPMAEMFGYATRLRSATQGRGTFTMEFQRYQPVDPALAERVLSGGR
jgi:elongation factor G